MTRIVQHHGYQFNIHAHDWINEESARKAEDKMELWLRGYGAAYTAILHQRLTEYRDGVLPEVPFVVQDAFNAGDRCALAVMEEEKWWRYPDSGHGCAIEAI